MDLECELSCAIGTVTSGIISLIVWYIFGLATPHDHHDHIGTGLRQIYHFPDECGIFHHV
jgi:hypothetical protein